MARQAKSKATKKAAETPVVKKAPKPTMENLVEVVRAVDSVLPPKGRKKYAEVHMTVYYENGECVTLAKDIDAAYKVVAPLHQVRMFLHGEDAVSALITRNALRYHLGNLKFKVEWSPSEMKLKKGSANYATLAAVTDA